MAWSEQVQLRYFLYQAVEAHNVADVHLWKTMDINKFQAAVAVLKSSWFLVISFPSYEGWSGITLIFCWHGLKPQKIECIERHYRAFVFETCRWCVVMLAQRNRGQAALNGGCPVLAQQMSDLGSCNLSLSGTKVDKLFCANFFSEVNTYGLSEASCCHVHESSAYFTHLSEGAFDIFWSLEGWGRPQRESLGPLATARGRVATAPATKLLRFLGQTKEYNCRCLVKMQPGAGRKPGGCTRCWVYRGVLAVCWSSLIVLLQIGIYELISQRNILCRVYMVYEGI